MYCQLSVTVVSATVNCSAVGADGVPANASRRSPPIRIEPGHPPAARTPALLAVKHAHDVVVPPKTGDVNEAGTSTDGRARVGDAGVPPPHATAKNINAAQTPTSALNPVCPLFIERSLQR
jgi:hypothetical protein